MGARDLEGRAREALGLAVEHARDPERAADHADEAVRLAEELADPKLLARALDARMTTHSGPDDLDARLGTSLRLLALVRHENDPDVRLAAHTWRLGTALEQIDLGTVRRQLAALDLLADETKEDRARFFACSRRAMFALTEGDTVGAARLVAEAGRAGSGVPDSAAVLRGLGAEVARQRGDRSALAEHATALEGAGRSAQGSAALAEAAVLWLESGDQERAGQLVDLLSSEVADLPRDGLWLVAVSKLCEAAAGSGREYAAATCAELLEPYAGRGVVKPLAETFAGVVEDYLALATGDADRADRARAAYRDLGADWWARRGPLGRPHERTPANDGRRVLHLHPIDTGGPTRLWCVGREGSVRMVPSMLGLEYLRLLVERPGTDVPALELSTIADPTVLDSGTGTLVGQRELNEHRDRIRDSAGAQTDEGHEREERARSSVRKAISAALARLELHDGEVAHTLRRTIRTGTTCRYEPDPFHPVEWRMSHTHPADRPVGGS